MYGTRRVVLLVEPAHPAVAVPGRPGRARAAYGSGEALEGAMRQIARQAVARLLGQPPGPFTGLAD